MNRILKSTLLFFVLMGLFSCKKDDSTTSIYVVPYSEQQPVDNAAIVEFLTNNYFNEEEFDNVGNFDLGVFKYDIKFSEEATVTGYDSNGDGVIDGSDADDITVFNRTPLIDYVNTVINNITIETKTITVSEVDHILYILKIEQGQGVEKPRFCDEALLSYEAITLDKNIFDNQLNPIKIDLSGTVKGFSESVSEFNTAATAFGDSNGTITYMDYGVGAVFMPSGLGYYNESRINIPAYSPLIFKLKVYGATELDHDNDDMPTYLEDLNGNHNLSDDDTDSDNSPNYLDSNDDNDPVLTINETIIISYIMDTNLGGTEPVLGSFEFEISREEISPGEFEIKTRKYIDTDGDGILDYLDSDS